MITPGHRRAAMLRLAAGGAALAGFGGNSNSAENIAGRHHGSQPSDATQRPPDVVAENWQRARTSTQGPPTRMQCPNGQTREHHLCFPSYMRWRRGLIAASLEAIGVAAGKLNIKKRN